MVRAYLGLIETAENDSYVASVLMFVEMILDGSDILLAAERAKTSASTSGNSSRNKSSVTAADGASSIRFAFSGHFFRQPFAALKS
jgi:hypothetical protein